MEGPAAAPLPRRAHRHRPQVPFSTIPTPLHLKPHKGLSPSDPKLHPSHTISLTSPACVPFPLSVSPRVAELAEFMLFTQFMRKVPGLFVSHFVESMVVFNDCSDHDSYKAAMAQGVRPPCLMS